MGKKRLFIGTFIESKPLKRHYSKIKKDFGGILPGRWIKVENFHITFKFLGYVDEERITEIKMSVDKYIDKLQEAELEFTGLSVFPNLNSPRVLYIGVNDKTGILTEVNRYVEEKLSFLGFEKEKKPFRPHITIKRIKSEIDTQKFIDKISKYKNMCFGKQEKIEVNLIESFTAPNGAIYKKI